MDQDKDREIGHWLLSWVKQVTLGRLLTISNWVKQQSWKIKLQPPSEQPLSFPEFSFTPDSSVSSTPTEMQRMGNEGCGTSTAFSLLLLPPHSLPLLQCGNPHIGYSPSWTAPKWILPLGCSSSRLLHNGPKVGCSLCQTTCSCVGLWVPFHGPQICLWSCSCRGS